MTRIVLAALAAAAAFPAFAQPPVASAPSPPAAGAPAGPFARPVTRAEVQAQVQAAFARFDTNHDGFVTRAEAEAARAAREAAAPEGGRFRRGGGGGTMFARFGGRGFDEMDANKDGKVSLAEAQAFATRIFDRFDTNRDGTISPEERQAAREAFRAARQAPSPEQR